MDELVQTRLDTLDDGLVDEWRIPLMKKPSGNDGMFGEEGFGRHAGDARTKEEAVTHRLHLGQYGFERFGRAGTSRV